MSDYYTFIFRVIPISMYFLALRLGPYKGFYEERHRDIYDVGIWL